MLYIRRTLVNKDQAEAFNIVRDLNYWVDLNYPELIYDYGTFFELRTVGDCSCITYCDITIWDSENDDREYNEEIDEYESLEEYVVNKINKLFSIFGKINIKL